MPPGVLEEKMLVGMRWDIRQWNEPEANFQRRKEQMRANWHAHYRNNRENLLRLQLSKFNGEGIELADEAKLGKKEVVETRRGTTIDFACLKSWRILSIAVVVSQSVLR